MNIAIKLDDIVRIASLYYFGSGAFSLLLLLLTPHTLIPSSLRLALSTRNVCMAKPKAAIAPTAEIPARETEIISGLFHSI
jgi:hypothetical protein